MKVAYISGPYRARGMWKKIPVIRTLIVLWNIHKARKVALKYWNLGYAVICPHSNTAMFDGKAPDHVWLEGYLEILRRCDVVVMMKGYTESEGAMLEWHRAMLSGIEIMYEWRGRFI